MQQFPATPLRHLPFKLEEQFGVVDEGLLDDRSVVLDRLTPHDQLRRPRRVPQARRWCTPYPRMRKLR